MQKIIIFLVAFAPVISSGEEWCYFWDRALPDEEYVMPEVIWIENDLWPASLQAYEFIWNIGSVAQKKAHKIGMIFFHNERKIETQSDDEVSITFEGVDRSGFLNKKIQFFPNSAKKALFHVEYLRLPLLILKSR